MANFVEFLDEADALVQEYIMFRGFTAAFSAFQQDLKRDHTSKFNVQKIVDKAIMSVNRHDYKDLMNLWNFLNFRFFCHLDGDFTPVVKRIEIALKRFFIVTAIAKGGQSQRENVLAFLRDECQGKSEEEDAEWRPWFALPFLPSPKNDSEFGIYFTQKWVDFFVSSFRNFLGTIFQNIPQPKLLNFSLSRQEIESLKLEVRSCKSEQARLQNKVRLLELQLEGARQRNKMLSLYRVDSLSEARSVFDSPKQAQAEDVDSNSPEFVRLHAESPGGGDEGRERRSQSHQSPPHAYDAEQTRLNSSQHPLVLGDDASEEPLRLGDDDTDDLSEPLALGEEEPTIASSRRPNNAVTPTKPPAPMSREPTQHSTPSSDKATPANIAAGNNGHGDARRSTIDTPTATAPYEVTGTVEIHGHSDVVTKCAFSTDGTFFASGSHDATVRIWSLADDPNVRRATRVKTFCCTGEILSLDWSSDTTFLFGTSQHEIRVVSVGSKGLAESPLRGGEAAAYVICMFLQRCRHPCHSVRWISL